MKVLILGGTGFLGQGLVAFCQRENISCDVVNRSNYSQFKGRSCDVLINANGNSKKYIADQDPILDFELSVISVLNSLHDFHFKKYVFISSIAVYNNARRQKQNTEKTPLNIAKQSHYGFHKYCAEQLVQHYCPSWMILRLGGLIGPGLKKGPVFDLWHKAPLWVHPESRFQFVDTREVARMIFALLKKKVDRQIYNICGRGTVTISELARFMDREAGSFDKPKEVWNINSDKAHKKSRLPKTIEAVTRFVQECRARPA